MDKVPEIDMLHESYLPCKEVISSISSPFHSQLADRKLAESVLDYPPD